LKKKRKDNIKIYLTEVCSDVNYNSLAVTGSGYCPTAHIEML